MPNTANHPARTQLINLLDRSQGKNSTTGSWQIGHLDRTRARPAAVLILFGVLDQHPAQQACTTVSSDLDLLILVRADDLRDHAGQPAFPGGRIDPQDRELAASSGIPAAHLAALREAEEETGLQPDGVEILGHLEPVELPVSNYLVTPVLGWWKLPSPVTVVDRAESSLVRRVPVADLLAPKNRHTATVRRGRQIHRSPAFDVHGDQGNFTIWGFTGFLLASLFEELGWEETWDRSREREVSF